MSGGLITALVVVVALVLFLSVIMIHEFGHFLFAKLFGVKVNEFSVGMGPRLFKKKGKETVYSFRLLPIGGFCAMEGEDEDSSDERAFNKKKVWKRIIIVAAGAIFNIILGFIFMFIITAQEDAYVSNTIAYTLTPVSAADVEMLSEAEIPLLQSTDINGGVRYFC
ncbi:MAG: site-2 protease family protein, partial [Clostridia bacterium]|nr:site-2 protease family protein [Clostridia bacterium]